MQGLRRWPVSTQHWLNTSCSLGIKVNTITDDLIERAADCVNTDTRVSSKKPLCIWWTLHCPPMADICWCWGEGIFIHTVVCYWQSHGYHVYVLWVQNPPPPRPTQAAQTIWPECDPHTTVSKPVIMNINVARTPPFRTGFPHTCGQGQTGGLMVWPDRGRWGVGKRELNNKSSKDNIIPANPMHWTNAGLVLALKRWASMNPALA